MGSGKEREEDHTASQYSQHENNHRTEINRISSDLAT